MRYDNPTQSSLLRLQSDVLFRKTIDGVEFYRNDAGVTLKGDSVGQFVEALAPALKTGTNYAQLKKLLNPPQVSMLQQLVRSLIEHDFLRLVEPRRTDLIPKDVLDKYGDVLNYIDYFVSVDVVERFANFRNANILVVGNGDWASGCAEGLAKNGAKNIAVATKFSADSLQITERNIQVCALSELDNLLHDADVIIFDTALLTITNVTRSTTSATVLLPVWHISDKNYAGPLSGKGFDINLQRQNPKVALNFLSRNENRNWDIRLIARLLGIVDQDMSDQHGPLAMIFGNECAFETFKLLTGAMKPQSACGLIYQDCVSGDLSMAPLPNLKYTEHISTAMMRQSSNDFGLSDSAEESTNSSFVLNELVNPVTGPISFFDDQDIRQIPIRVSSCSFTSVNGHTYKVANTSIKTSLEARMKTVMLGLAYDFDNYCQSKTGAEYFNPVESTYLHTVAAKSFNSAFDACLLQCLQAIRLKHCVSDETVKLKVLLLEDFSKTDKQILYLADTIQEKNIHVSCYSIDDGQCPGGPETVLICNNADMQKPVWYSATEIQLAQSIRFCLEHIQGDIQIRESNPQLSDNIHMRNRLLGDYSSIPILEKSEVRNTANSSIRDRQEIIRAIDGAGYQLNSSYLKYSSLAYPDCSVFAVHSELEASTHHGE
ncbi:hypothetical protein [Bifidobacterium tibiigranuli]|jgi:hypothetical protein|uniref:hypothetical protein n=1 Tax=Bifidobacterium tibiigranuli TaxID=2172043 RepID=UPI00235616CB|nr:hypothetical protein [Bifidobacterium tibiigranuli]MCH3973677.1 hypothetical protein [Bifidobacterium tibiigranuli]